MKIAIEMLGKIINYFKCLFLNLFIVCIIVMCVCVCVCVCVYIYYNNNYFFWYVFGLSPAPYLVYFTDLLSDFLQWFWYKNSVRIFTRKKIIITGWMKMKFHSLTVGDAFRKVKIPPVHTSLHCVRFWHLLVKEKEGSQTQFTCFQAVIQIFIFSVVFINSNTKIQDSLFRILPLLLL